MNRIIITVLAIAVAGIFISWDFDAKADKSEAEWDMLFNGKDLDGWKILNGEAEYRVENGVIIGTTKTGTPNTFLATEKTYRDFILELDLKVDPSMNSGIQFRSLSKADYRNGRVHGYQCEIDPSSRAWSGGIYDEARRGWLYPLSVNPQGQKAFNVNGWNRYRIEAIGNSLRTWINGVPCANLIDDMTAEGFIALQVHGIGKDEARAGKEVMWKNIRIQTENLVPMPYSNTFVINNVDNYVSPEEKAQGWELLFDGKSTDGWRGVGKDAFPEKGWHIEDGVLVVESSDGAESRNGGDIVTMDEYDMFELQLEFKLSEGANSGIKYFITESYGSGASAIGLEYQILDDDKHPDAKQGTGGNRTVASLYDLIPASPYKSPRKIGDWNHARIIVKGVRNEWLKKNPRAESGMFKGAYVQHWLNHNKVLEYERGNQAFYALVARSKYNKWEGFGEWQSGHILLQDHGDEVHFRNIKIRRLFDQ